MPKSQAAFSHPYDTPVSATLRFATELIAWIAAPWALSQASNWLSLLALIALVALPAIFSTPNDKRTVGVATPGPARLAIEALLYLVAAIAPWYIWSQLASSLACLIVASSAIAGIPRALWLLRGAPAERSNATPQPPPEG